jgi:hypothetical protein
MNNWSVLVHHAAAHHYKSGPEDFTQRVLSPVHRDAGISIVIRRPQDEPVDRQIRKASVPARLVTVLRCWVATLSFDPGGQEAAGQGSGVSDRPSAQPSEAGRYAHATGRRQ